MLHELDGRNRKVGKASLQDAERPRSMQWPSEAVKSGVSPSSSNGLWNSEHDNHFGTEDARFPARLGWPQPRPMTRYNRLASQSSQLPNSGICSSHILALQQLLLTMHQIPASAADQVTVKISSLKVLPAALVVHLLQKHLLITLPGTPRLASIATHRAAHSETSQKRVLFEAAGQGLF